MLNFQLKVSPDAIETIWNESKSLHFDRCYFQCNITKWL